MAAELEFLAFLTLRTLRTDHSNELSEKENPGVWCCNISQVLRHKSGIGTSKGVNLQPSKQCPAIWQLGSNGGEEAVEEECGLLKRGRRPPLLHFISIISIISIGIRKLWKIS